MIEERILVQHQADTNLDYMMKWAHSRLSLEPETKRFHGKLNSNNLAVLADDRWASQLVRVKVNYTIIFWCFLFQFNQIHLLLLLFCWPCIELPFVGARLYVYKWRDLKVKQNMMLMKWNEILNVGERENRVYLQIKLLPALLFSGSSLPSFVELGWAVEPSVDASGWFGMVWLGLV